MPKFVNSLQRVGPPRRRRHKRRARFESLENRLLLAIDVVAAEIGGFQDSNSHAVAEAEDVVPDFVVTTADDEDDPNPLSEPGDLSLREAIGLANENAGSDTIGFDEDAFAIRQTIILTLGELEITDSVAIVGLGQELLTIDGNQQSRVLDVPAGSVDVTLSGLTITGGRTTGDNQTAADRTHSGGGIRFVSSGALVLENTTISDNNTTGDYAAGGGIFSSGNLTITGSTISGNSTDGIESAFGGGIESYSGNLTISSSTITGNSTAGNNSHGGGIDSFDGDVTITGSTISGNSTAATVADGGGISADRGVVTITNSTISGNSTSRDGGGMRIDGQGTIVNTTIADNDAMSGGGVHANSTDSTLTIANSIIAGNRASDSSPDFVAAPSSNVLSSLIGERQGSGLAESQTANPETGNLVGAAAGAGVIDARLGPLASNGGTVQTHALLPDSPAIDAGDASLLPLDSEDIDGDGVTLELLPLDQRGGARVVDFPGVPNENEGLDIGAFELAANGAMFADATLIVVDGQIVVSGDGVELFSVPTNSNELLQVTGNDSDNEFTLNVSGGSVIPPGGLSIDGGSGSNALGVIGGDIDLDFTSNGNMAAANLARIDLSEPGASQITLDAVSVAAISPAGTLLVKGDAGDTIAFDDVDDWRMGDTSFVAGRFVRSVNNIAGGNETIDTDLPHPWQNVVKVSDVNNNGDVTAGDALIIINELARREFSSSDNQDLKDPSIVPLWPGTYYDQNGDDRATALDALRVINELARQANADAGENEAVVSARINSEDVARPSESVDAITANVRSPVSVFAVPFLAANETDFARLEFAKESELAIDAVDELLADEALLHGVLRGDFA